MGGRHRIDAAMARIADPAAAALSVLAFYVTGFGVFDDSMVSAGTVTLALLIGFLTHRRGEDEDRDEDAGTPSRDGARCTSCCARRSPASPSG